MAHCRDCSLGPIFRLPSACGSLDGVSDPRLEAVLSPSWFARPLLVFAITLSGHPGANGALQRFSSGFEPQRRTETRSVTMGGGLGLDQSSSRQVAVSFSVVHPVHPGAVSFKIRCWKSYWSGGVPGACRLPHGRLNALLGFRTLVGLLLAVAGGSSAPGTAGPRGAGLGCPADRRLDAALLLLAGLHRPGTVLKTG